MFGRYFYYLHISIFSTSDHLGGGRGSGMEDLFVSPFSANHMLSAARVLKRRPPCVRIHQTLPARPLTTVRPPISHHVIMQVFHLPQQGAPPVTNEGSTSIREEAARGLLADARNPPFGYAFIGASDSSALPRRRTFLDRETESSREAPRLAGRLRVDIPRCT